MLKSWISGGKIGKEKFKQIIYRNDSGRSFRNLLSRDIRLNDRITIEGTIELPIVYTENSTIKDLLKTKRGQELFNQLRSGLIRRLNGIE